MDFLHKASAQLGELFRSMTAGTRITAALLLTLVVISLAYLVNHQVSRGSDYLLAGHRFTSQELAAAEAAFGSARLNGHEVEGGQIRVPRAGRAQYMAALADAGAMPAHFSSYLLEAIAKPGPFTSSRDTERIWKVAVQRELAGIIGSMSGIEGAAVFFHTEKQSGLMRETVKTASVSVTPSGNGPLDPKQVAAIRDFVAFAIGMPPQGVVVMDKNGRSYRWDDQEAVVGALDDSYLSRKKKYQKDYETLVASALPFVPGAIVTASVELDPQMQQQNAGSTPKRVTIAVAVPAGHYERIWHEQNPTPPGQAPAVPDKKTLKQIEIAEQAKIQSLVSRLVPDPTGDPRPNVSVDTFHPFSVPELPQPDFSEAALHWVAMHYSTLAVALLGLVSLVMLRSMVRRSPPPRPAAPLALPTPQQVSPEENPPPHQPAKPRSKRRPQAGPALRDELVAMVREDPDAAASILRGWIGNAS